jgi:hypothetical protein
VIGEVGSKLSDGVLFLLYLLELECQNAFGQIEKEFLKILDNLTMIQP